MNLWKRQNHFTLFLSSVTKNLNSKIDLEIKSSKIEETEIVDFDIKGSEIQDSKIEGSEIEDSKIKNTKIEDFETIAFNIEYKIS